MRWNQPVKQNKLILYYFNLNYFLMVAMLKKKMSLKTYLDETIIVNIMHVDGNTNLH